MYGTTKNQLRNMPVKQYEALKQLSRLSKNLYNVALYNIRQHYFAEKKFLRYESNYHLCKTNENYALMGTETAQQTLKVVDRSFKSFFALVNKARSGNYSFNKIDIPHYLDKDGYFEIIIPRPRVKDGMLIVPTSAAFKRQYGEIAFKFPSHLNIDNINEVRIHPYYNARFFEVEYIYEVELEPKGLNPNNALGIDIGLDNLATCVTNTGASFIIDGKQLKSVNQWYNKENARLQSAKDLQGIKTFTNKQVKITNNRNNFVDDYMNKAARTIVNYCIEHDIGRIIIGYNIDFKRNINLGSKTNQNFVQIPHGKLRSKIEALCERYGIEYVEQEESYTSKASFFDNDSIPIYNRDNPQEYTFSGKRISRGQYRTASGKVINADCNGALNIIRKSSLVSLTALQGSGCLAQPSRIRL